MIQTLTSKTSQEFITQHEKEDPSVLALKYSGKIELPIQVLTAQIKSRQKAKSKLPEWYHIEGVVFPHGVSMEQCSSEKTAKYKSGLIKGKSLVDLTGGTGVDTFYLSKNFEQTTYVEQNKELCELAKHNFSVLGQEIKVIDTTTEEFLSTKENDADLYFIDPARRDNANKKVFRISDCQPNLIELLPVMMEKGSRVMVKFSPMLDIKETLKVIPEVKEVHVVSVNNECKEVLLLIENGFVGTPEIKAVNILNEATEHFTFSYNQENETLSNFSEPQKFLYEPNASILKAGAFKMVTSEFKINKLHRNSHLYTSEKLVSSFQGRTFRIIDVLPVSHKELIHFLENGKASLSTRNFPLSTQQLKKKLKLKDGGGKYIFATTLMDGKHKLIVCEKTQNPRLKP